MHNCAYLERQIVFTDSLKKIIAVKIINIMEVDQIPPFIGGSQPVNYDDIINTFLIEFSGKSAANKTRTAGYNYHINTLLFLLFS